MGNSARTKSTVHYFVKNPCKNQKTLEATMSFHPYSKRDVRIVSDLSRFEFESPTPRNRSRNTTPTSLDEKPSVIDLDHEFGSHNRSTTEIPPTYFEDDIPAPDPGPQRRRTLLEIAEATQALPKVRDPGYTDIYQYYEKPSTSSLVDENHQPNDFVPYPSSINEQQNRSHIDTAPSLNIPTISDEITLKTPITNQTSIMPSTPMTNFSAFNYKDKELPPIQQPSQYYGDQSSSSVYKLNEINSLSSRQKIMEDHLVKSVMNKPLFSIPADRIIRGDEFYEGKTFVITANFILYFFEMIIAIIIVTLSSILLRDDDRMGVGFYRYFIADSVISLIVSFLFMTTIVNFERRNGSFYVTAAMILSFVSFIITISVILPSKNCETSNICSLRRANSAFIIISAFLWLVDLVAFLTVLYISRMNLLGDLNFDYSNQGLQNEFNRSLESSSIDYNEKTKDDLLDPTSGQPLKQYWLNEQGEMFELNDEFDVRGKHKIIVYTV